MKLSSTHWMTWHTVHADIDPRLRTKMPLASCDTSLCTESEIPWIQPNCLSVSQIPNLQMWPSRPKWVCLLLSHFLGTVTFQKGVYHTLYDTNNCRASFFGFIYLFKIVIAPSTDQGHLRVFHKFKSYTCHINYKTERAFNIQRTIHKNKQKSFNFKSKNKTSALPLVYNSNKAETCRYHWPFSLIYQYQFTKTC